MIVTAISRIHMIQWLFIKISVLNVSGKENENA
jgi:hypothetical protein